MLEMFFKYLDFAAPHLTQRNHVEHEKNLFKFEDADVNKHWLYFLATFKAGRKSAFDEIALLALQNISKLAEKK